MVFVFCFLFFARGGPPKPEGQRPDFPKAEHSPPPTQRKGDAHHPQSTKSAKLKHLVSAKLKLLDQQQGALGVEPYIPAASYMLGH